MQFSYKALNTDLYELTMAAGYVLKNVRQNATFELFARNLPENRSYMVCAGLHRIIEFLQDVRFTKEDIDYLRDHPVLGNLDKSFFSFLKNFRFTGTVRAVPEGTVMFANEPLVQVTAPIAEAQIVETFLLTSINIETMVAGKAARVLSAACMDGKQRSVVDFGSRRAHGPEAAILAARASYLAGCAGSSNVQAGSLYGIPTSGTMAHSWVEAFDTEEDSFCAYESIFPDKTILIIDTYDVDNAIKTIISMGKKIAGIRLDSGDLLTQSKRVRTLLDNAGLQDVKIVASGNLDEFKIAHLISNGAPIDSFGVGTKMVTSHDSPSLNLVYKLVQVEEESGTKKLKAKISPGKTTYPGRKQVYRIQDNNYMYSKDIICLDTEDAPPQGIPLLKTYIENGTIINQPPPVQEARKYFAETKNMFCEDLFKIDTHYVYEVSPSQTLLQESKEVANYIKENVM